MHCHYKAFLLTVFALCAEENLHINENIYHYKTRSNVEMVEDSTEEHFGILPMQTEPLDLSNLNTSKEDELMKTDTITLNYCLPQNSIVPTDFQQDNPHHTYATSSRSYFKKNTSNTSQSPLICYTDSASLQPRSIASDYHKRKNTLEQKTTMAKRQRQDKNKSYNSSNTVTKNTQIAVKKDVQKHNTLISSAIIPDSEFSKGLYNAIKLHRGQNQTFIPIMQCINNTTFSYNNEIRYLDFEAFYNSNSDLSLPVQIGLKSVNRTHPCIIPVFLECYSENIKTITHALSSHTFGKKESIIQRYLNLPQFNNTIRFQSIIAKNIKINDNTREIVENIRSCPVTRNSFDYIKNVFQTYKNNTLQNNNYEQNRNFYISAVTKMLFCKDEMNDIYVLRPELWKLQLFMPEIYFYITWKIKRLSDSNGKREYYQKHFLAEINYIFMLLEAFYGFYDNALLTAETINNIRSQVVSFRDFILRFLQDNYPKTTSCTLYTFGYKTGKRDTKLVGNRYNSTILYMLAFTEQSTEYRESLHHMLNVNKTGTSEFVSNRLMKKQLLKEDTIATLHLMILFLSYMKNRQNYICCNGPAIMAFRVTTLIIYQREIDNIVHVLSISKAQTMQYFYEAIFDAILN